MKAVEVIEVAPVTTPASIEIVPSSKMACPAVGVMEREEAPAEEMVLALMVMSSTVIAVAPVMAPAPVMSIEAELRIFPRVPVIKMPSVIVPAVSAI